MANKEFALKKEYIKELISSQEGCFATDRITVDNSRVGFMYREKPDDGFPDSGWRFMAGDESVEYMDDANNIRIYQVNTICNYDPDIIPFLEAEYGCAFCRDKNGDFKLDEQWINPGD